MRILMYDIETRPNLAWVFDLWDQNISIDKIKESGEVICWSAKWLGEKEVFFASTFHDGKRKMVKGLHKLMSQADALMTYNGDKFDHLHMNAEFLKMGLPPPPPSKSIDLYRVVKARFKLPSYKLAYVAEALGIGSKAKHSGFALWKGAMAGDEKAWHTMRRYCMQDTRLLERLYHKLRPWIRHHPNHGIYSTEKVPVCTNCGGKDLQRRGVARTRVQVYARFFCKGCGAWLRSPVAENGKGARHLLRQDMG